MTNTSLRILTPATLTEWSYSRTPDGLVRRPSTVASGIVGTQRRQFLEIAATVHWPKEALRTISVWSNRRRCQYAKLALVNVNSGGQFGVVKHSIRCGLGQWQDSVCRIEPALQTNWSSNPMGFRRQGDFARLVRRMASFTILRDGRARVTQLIAELLPPQACHGGCPKLMSRPDGRLFWTPGRRRLPILVRYRPEDQISRHHVSTNPVWAWLNNIQWCRYIRRRRIGACESIISGSRSRGNWRGQAAVEVMIPSQWARQCWPDSLGDEGFRCRQSTPIHSND